MLDVWVQFIIIKGLCQSVVLQERIFQLSNSEFKDPTATTPAEHSEIKILFAR